MTNLEIELLTLISDLINSKDTSRKAVGAEVKRLFEEIRKDDNEKIARLESIIRAARNGEYNNAHEINAIRKFLRESMQEYYAAMDKSS